MFMKISFSLYCQQVVLQKWNSQHTHNVSLFLILFVKHLRAYYYIRERRCLCFEWHRRKRNEQKKLEMIFMEIRKSAVEMNIGWEWFYSTKGSIRKGCFRLYPKITKAQICMCLRTDCLLAFCHKSVTFDWINWTQKYANAWVIERKEKYTCPQQYVIHLPACSVFTTCLPYSWPLSLNIVHLSSFYPSYLSSEWMRYV